MQYPSASSSATTLSKALKVKLPRMRRTLCPKAFTCAEQNCNKQFVHKHHLRRHETQCHGRKPLLRGMQYSSSKKLVEIREVDVWSAGGGAGAGNHGNASLGNDKKEDFAQLLEPEPSSEEANTFSENQTFPS